MKKSEEVRNLNAKFKVTIGIMAFLAFAAWMIWIIKNTQR